MGLVRVEQAGLKLRQSCFLRLILCPLSCSLGRMGEGTELREGLGFTPQGSVLHTFPT